MQIKSLLVIVLLLLTSDFKFAQRSRTQKKKDVEILGYYSRQPIENDWHEGQITTHKRDQYRWTNKSGATWRLTLEADGKTLTTGPSNPYPQYKTFELVRNESGIQGFRFGGELYVRDGVTIIPQNNGGLKGYISAELDDVPSGYGHGVSFYVSVWSLLDQPLANFQIGLPSTWIQPDNEDFDQPLCPPGTIARDNWPERGPTWKDVFQTIEGGLGFWGSTRFPSALPKYRMNGTPNGYNHEISTPGWGFGKTAALEPDEIGIAQLSNRLLVPPDGITFQADTSGGVLGNAWMSLPLVPPQVVDRTPTGGQSWTLFLNSSTFAGPVAFWIPETWSRLSRDYPTIDSRGLDSRPGLMKGGAMEVNSVPYFVHASEFGDSHSKIPNIHFPVDDEGRTFLFQDVTLYSNLTLHDSVQTWLSNRGPIQGRFAKEGTHLAKLRALPLSFRQGPNNIPMSGLAALLETVIYDTDGGQAFGLRWKESGARGQFPQYWASRGGQLIPVSADDIPEDTKLLEQAFAKPGSFPSYEPPNKRKQNWKPAKKKHGPFTANLTDGSTVTYAWFRFIDQPALRNTIWKRQTKKDLQAFVEEIHKTWSSDDTYMPPPTRGNLAELDNALLVKPPRGCEIGYVPIALSQRKTE